MYKHHKEAIEKLAKHLESRSDIDALIIAGSVAQGRDSENSDIDIYLVVNDEVWMDKKQTKDYFFFSQQFCKYEGGYFDGKIINYQYLVDAAQHGSEPARAAFKDAFVAHTKIGPLDALLHKIPVYQEKERFDKLLRFHAQLLTWNGYFMGQAQKRNDLYLLSRAVSEIVLYGVRMILAHNQILYGHHKTLIEQLHSAPEKPAEIVKKAELLLQKPSCDTAKAFTDCVLSFQEWPKLDLKCWWIPLYFEDREWNWRTSLAPLEDR